jgi:glycosyltransferase involved in cell wall biosynthesis
LQFSIITPSFRASEWLKLCIASVADQEVELEHIVQDAVSDDGTLNWLPQDTRVKAFIEKDKGMYDAVNRGLRKSKGDLLAYINCDEQYLPGALRQVWNFFQENPETELVFADSVVVNADGSFNCFRKVQLPWVSHTRVNSLCTLTCSMFFRRSVIEKRQHFFSDAYRDLGDSDWVVRALRNKIPMKVMRGYTAVFTETGENMNLKPNAMRERQVFAATAPLWVQKGKGLVNGAFKLSRALNGTLLQKPFSYSIYTKSSPNKRVPFNVEKPTPYWKRVPLTK